MNVINYILFILFFLIMYSVCFKTVEGFDDEFYYYDKLIDYKTIPNSYVNDATPSKTVNKFGFYKGKGTFKKGYTKETKSDEKISTLNKLLNRLLGNIVSDNQDCVGSFGKYSECDKSCGSNALQTRKYNITQERGKNGKDCPFVDGYEEKLRCNLDECQLGDICENNADCETGNCNPDSTRCENMVPCDSDNVHVCNETQCINLNNDNNNDKMIEGTYIYNNVDKECFFKTPAEIEELNLNIYTYDFGEIRGKVKDIVLDCEYYQIKKDDTGPCVNRPNIIIDDNDEPKCSLGFGPEPTIFNASYSCSKCIIEVDGETKPTDECYCPSNKTISVDGTSCEGLEGVDTDNLCKADVTNKYLKHSVRGQTGCTFCGISDQVNFSIKKDGNNMSCIECPTDTKTLRDFCIHECGGRVREDDPKYEICKSYCGEGWTNDDSNIGSELPFDKIKQYLNITEQGGSPIDLNSISNGDDLNDKNYTEQCINFNNDTSCNQEELEIPRDCYCEGEFEDRKVKDNYNDCSGNCIEGYIWNNSNCERCPTLSASLCSSSDESSIDPLPCVKVDRIVFNEILDRNASEKDRLGFDAGYSDEVKVRYCLEAADNNNLYISNGEVVKCSSDLSNGVCNECQAGTYQSDSGCQNCPAGKFNDRYNCTNGEENCCQDCDDGSISSEGSSSCRVCEKGHHSNGSHTECLPCDRGKYQDQRGQGSCKVCPGGTYQDEQGKSYCKVKRNCWVDPDGIKYYINQGSSTEDSQCNDSPTINRWCIRSNGAPAPRSGSSFVQGPVFGTWYHPIGDCNTNYSNYDLDDDVNWNPITHYNCNSSHINTDVAGRGGFSRSVDGGSLHQNQVASGPDARATGSGHCLYQYGCEESSPATYCYLKPGTAPTWEPEIKRWYDADKEHLAKVTGDDVPSDTSSR